MAHCVDTPCAVTVAGGHFMVDVDGPRHIKLMSRLSDDFQIVIYCVISYTSHYCWYHQ